MNNNKAQGVFGGRYGEGEFHLERPYQEGGPQYIKFGCNSES